MPQLTLLSLLSGALGLAAHMAGRGQLFRRVLGSDNLCVCKAGELSHRAIFLAFQSPLTPRQLLSQNLQLINVAMLTG